MTIWRLHVNTSGGNCADICLKNKVMAMGWSITDRHIENFTEARKKKICEQRVNIHSYKDYEKLIKKWKVYDGKYGFEKKGNYMEVCNTSSDCYADPCSCGMLRRGKG